MFLVCRTAKSHLLTPFNGSSSLHCFCVPWHYDCSDLFLLNYVDTYALYVSTFVSTNIYSFILRIHTFLVLFLLRYSGFQTRSPLMAVRRKTAAIRVAWSAGKHTLQAPNATVCTDFILCSWKTAPLYSTRNGFFRIFIPWPFFPYRTFIPLSSVQCLLFQRFFHWYF